jgi:hypothetical protein
MSYGVFAVVGRKSQQSNAGHWSCWFAANDSRLRGAAMNETMQVCLRRMAATGVQRGLL